MRVHPKSLLKLKAKLKMLTGRSNGMGYERRKVALHQVIRGWVSYFKYADVKSLLIAIDQWLRRRIRMCIWKSWKRPKTRIKNLIRCGIKPYWARIYGNSSKGYWANAELHVRWCERSENESRKKTTSFSSYSIFVENFSPFCDRIFRLPVII